MADLTRAQIECLVEAAISVQLTKKRDLLLEGLPAGYIASLDVKSVPKDQLLADVNALNKATLHGIHHPILIWLQNAHHMIDPQCEAQLFAGLAGLIEPNHTLEPSDSNNPRTVKPPRWGWLLGGLFTLGLCVGLIAGLSNAEGTGKHLMTLVMTFIGGTLLSYAGLQWQRAAPRIRPAQIGAGMLAFAPAVILGVGLGISARSQGWLAGKPSVAASTQSRDLQQCEADLSACTGGALRGDCLPTDLIDTATGWDQAGPASARRSCINFFTDYAPALAICGKAYLALQNEIDDAVPQARALIDLAVRLNPDAKYVAAAKERLP